METEKNSFTHEKNDGRTPPMEIECRPAGMAGKSPCMLEVFKKVKKISPTDVPVLVTGESGTGKELIARAIHANSTRRESPFIAINCAAIPDNLLESELFGHERGAFTGAHMQRPGKIELACGGTLFLDEIAELPATLQVKMLRFLQDHLIERVGGRESIAVDIRVIAATNRPLKKMIAAEKFREDLYYRIAAVTIDVPPLRDRGGDVLLLANTFLQKYGPGRALSFSKEASEIICAYRWPGNVREMENRIRRAVAFCESGSVAPHDLGFEQDEKKHSRLNLKEAVKELEIKFVSMAILKHKGNISKAAEELGMSRPTLHNIIKKYNITK